MQLAFSAMHDVALGCGWNIQPINCRRNASMVRVFSFGGEL